MKMLSLAGGVMALVAAAGMPVWTEETVIPMENLRANSSSPLASFRGILGGALNVSSIMRLEDSSDQIWNATTGNVPLVNRDSAFNTSPGFELGMSSGPYGSLFITTGGSGNDSGPSASLDLNGPFDPRELAFQSVNNANQSGPIDSTQNSDKPDGLDHGATWMITGGLLKDDSLMGSGGPGGGFGRGNDRFSNDGILLVAGAPPAKSVPEPGTLALLATGLLGVLAWSRRRKKGSV